MDNSGGDQREEHRQDPNLPVSLDHLSALGVRYFRFDADNDETYPELQSFREREGFSDQDIICISPDKLPNYEEKIKTIL